MPREILNERGLHRAVTPMVVGRHHNAAESASGPCGDNRKDLDIEISFVSYCDNEINVYDACACKWRAILITWALTIKVHYRPVMIPD